MTILQRLALRLSSVRQKLNSLSNKDELSDQEKDEMRTLTEEYPALEERHRAALISESTEEKDSADGGEGKEYRRLVEQASIGAIVTAASEHRSTDGATRELQDELGLNANQIPLDLLRPVEVRTSGVTPAPGEVGQTQRPIIPAVFPQAVATWLGIRQESVPVGESVYTVLSTSATPGTPAEGADQAHSAGVFTATVLSPARIQASLFYSREDRARFAGMGEALRMNLSDALSYKLDDEVLTGTKGLFTGTNLSDNDASAVDSFASYRSRMVYASIDGTYASQESDLRVLVGSSTLAHMSGLYRSNTADDSVLDSIRRMTGGVRVSAHVPAVSGNKQEAIVRRGMRQDYACGIWEGVTIITDEVTQAKAGEIVLTAVMLYACSVLRGAGFRRVETQHAS